MHAAEIEDAIKVLDATCCHKNNNEWRAVENIWYYYPPGTDIENIHRIVVSLEDGKKFNVSTFRVIYKNSTIYLNSAWALLEALAEYPFVHEKLIKPIP